MKRTALSLPATFLALAAAFVSVQPSRAATVLVDNFDNDLFDVFLVASEQFLAMSFTVGNDWDFWQLDAVYLALAGYDTPAQDFSVELREDVGGVPGGSVVTLLGSVDPFVFDAYAYVPPPNTTLAAGSTYWITAASMSISADGGYVWVTTDDLSDTGTAGWSIGDDIAASVDQGANWSTFGGEVGYLAIVASAVPEPTNAIGTLLLITSACLMRVCPRRRTVTA